MTSEYELPPLPESCSDDVARKLRSTAFLIATFAVVGCTNTAPVIVNSTCIRSHTEIMLVPVLVPCGQGCTMTALQSVPYQVCDQAIRVVRASPEYRP